LFSEKKFVLLSKGPAAVNVMHERHERDERSSVEVTVNCPAVLQCILRSGNSKFPKNQKKWGVVSVRRPISRAQPKSPHHVGSNQELCCSFRRLFIICLVMVRACVLRCCRYSDVVEEALQFVLRLRSQNVLVANGLAARLSFLR
jgi:hypothetical protein